MEPLLEHLKMNYSIINGVYCKELQNRSLIFREMQYVERSEVLYTTSFYEYRQTEKILTEIISDAKIFALTAPKIFDVGAGDGRIYKILKNNCPEMQYVSVEYDYLNAKKISTLDERIISICDDACSVELPDDYFDMSIAWGIFHNFDNQQYRALLDKLTAYTRNGGYVIIAEPTLESVLLYSLVKRDINEFVRIYRTTTRPSIWENKDVRYNVNFIQKTKKSIIEETKLRIVREYGVNIWPSLIFGNILQDVKTNDDTLVELERIVNDYFDEQSQTVYSPRTIVYVCKLTK